MKKNILYGGITLVLVAGIFWLFISQQSTPKQTQQQLIDSLQTEIIGLQIDNGRYEIILNQLWEADSNFVMEHTKYIE